MEGDGLCFPCYTKSPHRITVRAGNLAAQLNDPPPWLPDFADYLVPRHNASASCQMITDTGRLLRDGGPVHPQPLLERAAPGAARWPGHWKTSSPAAGSPCLPATPDTRPPAAGNAAWTPSPPHSGPPRSPSPSRTGRPAPSPASRNQPPGHHTIESHLTSVRDFALVPHRGTRDITDWATVGSGDIEAFLAAQPSAAAHRLGGLRRFFRFAARRRMILTDPAAAITITQPQGFTGPSLTRGRQRELFRRWTAGTGGIHPHESLTGLLALIHGSHHPGNPVPHHRRHHPGRPGRHAPRAPAAYPARPVDLGRCRECLAYRQALNSTNPYLLVTPQTKATRAPSGDSYVKNTLRAASIRPRILRSSRILALVSTADPKLIATAYGMTYGAVPHYLADGIDPTRLPNP